MTFLEVSERRWATLMRKDKKKLLERSGYVTYVTVEGERIPVEHQKYLLVTGSDQNQNTTCPRFLGSDEPRSAGQHYENTPLVSRREVQASRVIH